MEKKYIDNYKKCIEVWGIDAQIKMCIEEMSELTKELCKYYRKGEMNCDAELKDHICEEIADVQVMLDQFKIANPEIQRKSESIMLMKVKRQLTRIQQEQERDRIIKHRKQEVENAIN